MRTKRIVEVQEMSTHMQMQLMRIRTMQRGGDELALQESGQRGCASAIYRWFMVVVLALGLFCWDVAPGMAGNTNKNASKAKPNKSASKGKPKARKQRRKRRARRRRVRRRKRARRKRARRKRARRKRTRRTRRKRTRKETPRQAARRRRIEAWRARRAARRAARQKAWAARLAVLETKLQELEQRGDEWYAHKVLWKHYDVPKGLGPFPFPIELVPRVLFWANVFARHPYDSVVVYSKRQFFVLGHHRVPGAGLVPSDKGAQRRAKTKQRAIAARPVLQQLRDGVRILASREAKAEGIEKRYWWKWRKQCRYLQGRKKRRRCYRLLKSHPRLYRRSVWMKQFASLPPIARKVMKELRKNPGWRAPGWHKLFRTMRRSGLSWQSSYRAFFRKGLKVHLRYRKEIHRILRKSKVPIQLAALPFVESMYNPWVRSFVGALGLWQIMPMTGKELSLFVSPKGRKGGFFPPIDERLDPLYATHAAAHFVRLCRYYFKKNWPLAITSYNQGPGRILKLARRHRSRYLPHLIRRASKRRFGYDGRNFYAKFLASALILHRTKSYFPDMKTKPLRFVSMRLPDPIWTKKLIEMTQLRVPSLLMYNPVLVRLLKRRRHPIPAHFPLRLPAKVAKRLQRHLRASRGKASILLVKSKRRESVYKIARRYRVPLMLVRKQNLSLLKGNTGCEALREQKLVWRRWRSRYRKMRRRGKRLKRPDGVRPLSRKERRFFYRKCRSRAALYKRLPEGTTVRIPAFRRASKYELQVYRVRGSEPLSWIACRACTTVWHLRSLNPNVPIKRLRAGTNLRVPVCPWERRRLFPACHVYHYSRSRARKSRRRARRPRRSRRRRANN